MICNTNIGNFSMLQKKTPTIPSQEFPSIFLYISNCGTTVGTSYWGKLCYLFRFLLCKNLKKLQLNYLENLCTLPTVNVPHVFLSFLLGKFCYLFRFSTILELGKTAALLCRKSLHPSCCGFSSHFSEFLSISYISAFFLFYYRNIVVNSILFPLIMEYSAT